MRSRSRLWKALAIAPLVVTACTLSLLSTPPPPVVTASPVPSATPMATASPSSSPGAPSAVTPETAATISATAPSFCQDSQPTALIDKFETAIRTSDGELLASLVSPEHGMDARMYRNGRVVNYDREHAAALFESTFEINWGTAPGSGLETSGSFHELLVPDLLDVLTKEYDAACNHLLVGGTTYTATWAYPGIDFYTIHSPGTPSFDGLDWRSWLLGMHYVGGKPYLYAIMQFEWEP